MFLQSDYFQKRKFRREGEIKLATNSITHTNIVIQTIYMALVFKIIIFSCLDNPYYFLCKVKLFRTHVRWFIEVYCFIDCFIYWFLRFENFFWAVLWVICWKSRWNSCFTVHQPIDFKNCHVLQLKLLHSTRTNPYIISHFIKISTPTINFKSFTKSNSVDYRSRY